MSEKRSLLRGQGFLLLNTSIGVVVGLVALYVVRGIIDPDDAVPPGILAVGVAVALVVAVPGMVLALLIVRRLIGDRIEVALREPGGKWRHGRLTVTPAHLSFQPYRWQLRIPGGEPIGFAVQHVTDTGRRPSWRQLWSVNPLLRIVEIDTDRGIREVGVQKHQVDELRERLNGKSPDTHEAS